ncbi:adenylate cyclase family protein (plasmid) [Cupriavidus necator N-1]|uniref:Adenylate cyclase family protein n=1 Tax=Cupriavidus necator (strain ATCC 43291 / DSM 13513 / CCUG 52238 / LMG 8453 / N-1) TaxID=1042878 RepID=F8GU97_CUPNN|nr:adenylate/guanylate cyclase domain-containing protein [Cupriavidus necator]AEI82301.1 adenylate cyclase family protein [Cupriavidus necator N-1]MDX6007318.1 adenylate/guanylate cyclase domain-containing protein [Cupriavidus necator]
MVRCTICGFDNAEGANFCEQCGSRLACACRHCGHPLSPTARFCNACGATVSEFPIGPSATPAQYTPRHLAERIRAEQAALEARGMASGERKTITVLFADMAGSTALIHDWDPEAALHLISPVIEMMMEAVHYYEGYVAKSLGDGILALFGAPIAHEDHPQRALYAALRMQEAMRQHSERLRLEQGISLQIRVGIHTGEVVVRSIRKDDLHTDYDPVGPTIHIASRMETMAAPSSILVSDPTYRLAEGYFDFKALGAAQVKGVPKPLEVYEVTGVGALRTRLQVAAHRGLARFVGREAELAALHRALDESTAGHGQIIAVVGEAGVGKSRLFHEFKARSQRGCLVLETFSVSHGKAFPYLPLIELMRNYFQITAQDDDRRSREKVTGKVLMLDRSLEGLLPYLLFLLGLGEPGSAVADMGASLRRERAFEAITRLMVRESENQPIQLLFEDLQWLDSETEACLAYISERAADARILLLVNYRSEYRCTWDLKANCTELRLAPLGPIEAQGLLTALLGDDSGLGPLKQLILEKTEGNPFFMEEVVQTLSEENTLLGVPGHYRIEKTPAALHIPTTVQGVLVARMDRLPIPEKELLQTLAVIGKEFPLSLIREVARLEEDRLYSQLASLEAGEFIYGRADFPEVEYAFKHALTQEVAGNSLLSDQRGVLHERTGRAIESLFQNQLKDYCSELAHHYSLSGNIPKAVEYLLCAGQQALERSAHLDAIRHLSTALELVERLPRTQERDRREISLRVALGPALIAARSYASSEVETNYKRALSLCEKDDNSAQLFEVKFGLRLFYSIRGEHQTAYALGEALLALAERMQDPVLLVHAQTTLGATSFLLGEPHRALAHLEQGLAYYQPEQQGVHYGLYGQDPGVRGLSILARVLWYLGYPDQARDRAQEALVLARKLQHPFSLALAVTFAAETYQCRHEVQLVQECADAAIELSTEQGFPFWLAWGNIMKGWALAEQGRNEEGISRIDQGLAVYQALGAELCRPYFLALQAMVYASAGQARMGLDILADALVGAGKTGERYYEAELHRLKGEFLLQCGNVPTNQEEARACFHRAIEIARRQGAKSLELRAAISLARLRQQQGKTGTARRALACLYEAFAEGFDSADLQRAKALLDE